MVNKNKQLESKVADYYSEKIRQFGSTPAGVDWNGSESQQLRFEQLTQVLPAQSDSTLSIADLGCGYGAFYDHLNSLDLGFSYHGYDLSSEMCSAAMNALAGKPNIRITQSGLLEQSVDFSFASGIFNVQAGIDSEQWLQHIISTLDNLNKFSIKGFAFNCLTSYSDQDKMRDYLYYANPAMIFDLCKTSYSRNVALLHDYELYEFTVLVRK